MGLTERHWFEDEEPELTEQQLEDIVYENKRAYDSGYAKGYSARDNEIVRCKDCKYSHIMTSNLMHPKVNKCWCEKDFIEGWHEPDWFCADGERSVNLDG